MKHVRSNASSSSSPSSFPFVGWRSSAAPAAVPIPAVPCGRSSAACAVAAEWCPGPSGGHRHSPSPAVTIQLHNRRQANGVSYSANGRRQGWDAWDAGHTRTIAQACLEACLYMARLGTSLSLLWFPRLVFLARAFKLLITWRPS